MNVDGATHKQVVDLIKSGGDLLNLVGKHAQKKKHHAPWPHAVQRAAHDRSGPAHEKKKRQNALKNEHQAADKRVEVWVLEEVKVI